MQDMITEILQGIIKLNPEDTYFDGSSMLCFDWYFEGEDAVYVLMQSNHMYVVSDKDGNFHKHRFNYDQNPLKELKEILNEHVS